jgi:DNA-binding NtrC family response regulator
VDPAVPVFAFDPDQLVQVLWNLARNGVEAMGGHGHLALEVTRQNGEVLVAISDTGCGIPAVVLPPLRERREDILALAEHFLGRFGGKHGRTLRLSPEALERLLRYPWPGNVRELENAIQRTAILARSDAVGPEELPPHIAAGTVPGPAPSLLQEQSLAEMEKAHIFRTLERYGWHQARAAEALGIGRTTLWRKLKEYGLER